MIKIYGISGLDRHVFLSLYLGKYESHNFEEKKPNRCARFSIETYQIFKTNQRNLANIKSILTVKIFHKLNFVVFISPTLLEQKI